MRRAATVRSAWPAQNLRLPPGQIQTVIFLKLLVAGHLTIYITRSEWWFWKRPWPSARLFWTTEATQALGTLAAVYGWFLEPIGWGDALLVWAYADRVVPVQQRGPRVGARPLGARLQPPSASSRAGACVAARVRVPAGDLRVSGGAGRTRACVTP